VLIWYSLLLFQLKKTNEPNGNVDINRKVTFLGLLILNKRKILIKIQFAATVWMKKRLIIN